MPLSQSHGGGDWLLSPGLMEPALQAGDANRKRKRRPDVDVGWRAGRDQGRDTVKEQGRAWARAGPAKQSQAETQRDGPTGQRGEKKANKAEKGRRAEGESPSLPSCLPAAGLCILRAAPKTPACRGTRQEEDGQTGRQPKDLLPGRCAPRKMAVTRTHCPVPWHHLG